MLLGLERLRKQSGMSLSAVLHSGYLQKLPENLSRLCGSWLLVPSFQPPLSPARPGWRRHLAKVTNPKHEHRGGDTEHSDSLGAAEECPCPPAPTSLPGSVPGLPPAHSTRGYTDLQAPVPPSCWLPEGLFSSPHSLSALPTCLHIPQSGP